MTTIELGELSAQPDDDGPDGFSPARVDPRFVRRVALGLTLLFCLLGVTASIRPEPHGLRSLWKVPAAESDSLNIVGDTAVITRTTGGTGTMTAYELDTGRVRWERQLTEELAYQQVAEAAGLVLIGKESGEVVISRSPYEVRQFARSTVALDAHTGRELWTIPGEPQLVSADSALMADFDGQAQYSQLRRVRLADQKVVWTRDVPGAYLVSNSNVFPEDTTSTPDKIITVDHSGTVEVIDYADGERVSRGPVRWLAPDPSINQYADANLIGGVLVVNRNQQERGDLTVYELGTMKQLWHIDQTFGYAFACGSAVCLNGDKGLAAYEPGSGRVIWQRTDGMNGWAVGPGRLIVQQNGGGESGKQFLVDAATGRRIGEPVLGDQAWSTGREKWLILRRPTVSPPDLTSISRWDLTTGRISVLGAVSRFLAPRCQYSGRYLACIRTDGYEVMAVG